MQPGRTALAWCSMLVRPSASLDDVRCEQHQPQDVGDLGHVHVLGLGELVDGGEPGETMSSADAFFIGFVGASAGEDASWPFRQMASED